MRPRRAIRRLAVLPGSSAALTARPPALQVWVTLALLIGLACLAGEPARASIAAGRMSISQGYPKDFAVVKRNGLFHVFYIEAGPGGDSNYLGHQTSPDLYHWTLEPNVLVAGRSDWNADFVWAPSIIERDGVYTMFYTGARSRPGGGCPGAPYQQIGVASSTDLSSWTLEPESWLDPIEVPWALQPADSCAYPSFGAFRDPFVMRDPVNDAWLLYYVTVPSPDATRAAIPSAGPYDPTAHVVGMGQAPAAFQLDSDWTDREALWVAHAEYPGGPAMRTWESPHLFRRTWQGEDLWFLFASTGRETWVEGVHFMTGPSPTLSRFQKKGKPGWTWRGPIGVMQIRDKYGHSNSSFGWFATEYFRDPETGLEYFANVGQSTLDFRQLTWRAADYGFDLQPPFAMTEMEVRPWSFYVGQPVDVILRATNGEDGAGPKTVRLELLRVDAQGELLGVVPPPQSGLPDSVLVTSDETHVTWKAPDLDTSPFHLRLRLAAPDTEVESQILYAYPAQRNRAPSEGPSHDTGSAAPATETPTLELRTLASPGPAPSLAIRLPVTARATLSLYDVRGRRVRVLVDQDLPRGRTDVVWDGRDDAGRRLPGGVYFALLRTAAGERTARLLVMRSR